MRALKVLLPELLSSEMLNDARDVVSELETEHGYEWRAVGDREANYGHINIGSDPGYALIERVTNAMDALVEAASALALQEDPSRAMPMNPREAVERWFEIPAGRIRNLEESKRQELAEGVTVSLLPGSRGRSYPSIRIRDRGIGLTRSLIPTSILSLGESNKIDKPYLAGAYGQGGSTTFAFSPEGTLLASRRRPDLLSGEDDHVSVTFVRFRDLDPTVNKNGRYEYLVTPERALPSMEAGVIDEFDPGTLVLHFDYDLAKYSAQLTQLTKSMWWLLNNSLFDPVLPLWAEDYRSKVTNSDAPLRRSIVGNHSRLWRDRRSKVEHTDSVQVQLPHATGDSRVVAHYWVTAWPDDGGRRSTPIASYVDPYRPVTYTYFGQAHGFEDRRFVAQRLQLPYLDRYLILQIELDHLTAHARRAILSTTRDRLKESTLYEELRERLAHALAEDPELIRLNEVRKEAVLSSYSEDERKKMRDRFARLLENLSAGRDADVPSKGQGEGGRPKSEGRSHEPLQPLETRDEPTYLRVANVQRPLLVQVDRAAVVRLESDAPDGYLAAHDPHARLVLSFEPTRGLAMESRSDFKGGRSRVLVRPGPEAREGVEGKLTVFLLTPDGDSFQDQVTFRIVEPAKPPTSGDKRRGKVKAPEPVPIAKDQWSGLGWNEESVALVDEDQTGVRILVNMDNRHLAHLLKVGGYREQGLQRMKNSYLLYCAYYAWLQDRALSNDSHGLSGEEFDLYKEEELDRASQTVISAIAAEGRLE